MLKYFFTSAIIEPREKTKAEIEAIKAKQLEENRKLNGDVSPKTTKLYAFI